MMHRGDLVKLFDNRGRAFPSSRIFLEAGFPFADLICKGAPGQLKSDLSRKGRRSDKAIMNSFISGVFLVKERTIPEEFWLTTKRLKLWPCLRQVDRSTFALVKKPNMWYSRRLISLALRYPNSIRSIWGTDFSRFSRNPPPIAKILCSHMELFFPFVKKEHCSNKYRAKSKAYAEKLCARMIGYTNKVSEKFQRSYKRSLFLSPLSKWQEAEPKDKAHALRV
jgi:hypothetical protein